MIPLFKVFMSPDVADFVNPVLQSGYIGDGPRVQFFESELGKFLHNPNIVMLNSGTSAIVMALRLAGVEYGDYVLTTPMTCLATNMAILSLGAKPIWTDVLLDGNMDISRVPDITGRHIKAIVCVDWGGTPCDMDSIYTKARVWGVPLIEDACQALGASYEDKMTGNHADFVCFSFQAIKNLTTGDGGALVIQDKNLYERAKLLKWFGLDRTKTTHMRCEQDPPVWGYKFQSNDIAAAIGLANLRYLPDLLAKARAHAEIYNKELGGLDPIRVIQQEDWVLPTYWLYTILVPDTNDFTRFMFNRGIEVSKAHTRNDTKTVFKQYWHGDRPGTSHFDRFHVCIPAGWWLSDSNVDQIVSAIRDYCYEHDSSETSDTLRELGVGVA
jgi:perosamine synthetase